MKIVLTLTLIITVLFSCRFTTRTGKHETIVCINFDDNALSVYENALPIMNQYGFRGTMFVNSGLVGRTNRLSWIQLDSLKNYHGWEIGGHTLHHELLSDLSYNEAEQNIKSDYLNLKAHGLNPKSFATTYGHCPTEYYQIISKYYKNTRTCFNIPMYVPLDRNLLGCFSMTNEMSAQYIMNRITMGLVEGENLIILLFHEVSDQNISYLSNCTPATFAEIMRRLNELKVKVMPLHEAVEYLSD